MVEVRRAGVGDQDALLPLIREFYEIDNHPYDEPVVLAGLGPLLIDDGHGQLWLVAAQDGGEPVGYAVVTWGWSLESGGRDSLLDELYVRHRGVGLGRALLEHAMTQAAAAGASRMFLETESHNSRVRAFYASLGFALEDSVWMAREFGAGEQST